MSKRTAYIIIAVYAVTFTASSIWTKNYDAIMWVLYTTWLMWRLYRQTMKVMETKKANSILLCEVDRLNRQLEFADSIIELAGPCDTVREAEGKQEAYLANCSRLLKENEQLRILNKNLLHNQGKGVKNFCKKK